MYTQQQLQMQQQQQLQLQLQQQTQQQQQQLYKRTGQQTDQVMRAYGMAKVAGAADAKMMGGAPIGAAQGVGTGGSSYGQHPNRNLKRY